MKKSEEHPASEFEKFDSVMRKVLSVSHSELQKREKAYQKKRKKRTKS